MKNRKPLILIIEDEIDIREMIQFSLSEEFKVITAEHAKEAFQQLADHTPDLILLDWMLPGKNGVEIVNELKKSDRTKLIPIILLTARADEDSKIIGLENGADDYITKPFSTRELITRIKTVLRRGSFISPEGIIHILEIQLNTNTHEVMIKKEIVSFPPLAYQLFYFFIMHPNRIYDREQLLNKIWKDNHEINDRTVDTQIRRLRKILTPFGYENLIQTKRSQGYLFAISVDV